MKAPKVTFNKNGYEIRTEILDMAKGFVENEYNAKFNGWQLTSKQDPETKELVTSVDMPTYPGIDEIMEVAQTMYGFVNEMPTSTWTSKKKNKAE